jgi:hypothetical protein
MPTSTVQDTHLTALRYTAQTAYRFLHQKAVLTNVLLKMGIIMLETCWENKPTFCCFKLVIYFLFCFFNIILISVIKTDKFISYRTEVAVCSKINKKHINTVWAEFKLLNFELLVHHVTSIYRLWPKKVFYIQLTTYGAF